MEYIEDSLDKAFHHFEGARSLVIVPQIIKAVNFMHNKNYVHRDIKPGNILICWVDDRPILKMADVGTMKEDDDFKTFAGTPFYMAPEY
jgi:serine/threonine protein kinase